MTSDNDTTQSETEESGAFDFLPTSRRNVLAGSAGALGLFGAAGAGGLVGGEEHEDGNETSTDDGTTEDSEEQEEENPWGDDVGILNYALTLERLEASFYEEAMDTMDQEQLFEWGPLSELDSEHQDQVWEYLGTVQEHEQQHVEALEGAIEDLGGEVSEEPEFDFGEAVEDPQTFVETAIQLEDTGVGAYAGAAPYLENEDLVPPALSIHSVEGRHAAFVRALCTESPFPNAFDEALEREEVLDRVSGFIAEAPSDMEEDVDTDQEPEDSMEDGNQTETDAEEIEATDDEAAGNETTTDNETETDTGEVSTGEDEQDAEGAVEGSEEEDGEVDCDTDY